MSIDLCQILLFMAINQIRYETGEIKSSIHCKTSGFLFQSRMRNTFLLSKPTVSETTEDLWLGGTKLLPLYMECKNNIGKTRKNVEL